MEQITTWLKTRQPNGRRKYLFKKELIICNFLWENIETILIGKPTKGYYILTCLENSFQ